jgi:hypothetical protein
MGRRAARGKPMFTGDASHIHHRLIAKGLDQTRAAMVIYTVCAVLSCAAIAMALHQLIAVAAALAVLSVVLILGLWYLGYLNYFISHEIQTERNRFRAAYHLAEASKAEIALAQCLDELWHALRLACRRLHLLGLRLDPEPRGAVTTPLNGHLPLELKPNGDEARSAAVDSDALHQAGTESYRFRDSGLRVTVRYPSNPAQGDLALEERALIAEILKVANDRILKMGRTESREADVTVAVPTAGSR